MIQGKDSYRPFPDREAWSRHNRRELAGEARAIDRQLAFKDGFVVSNFFAVIAGNRFYDGLGARKRERPDTLHVLAQPFMPNFSVWIEHHFDGFGITERRHQERTEIAFQFPLR